MTEKTASQLIADIRKEYEDQGISIAAMCADPFDEFDKWFQAAVTNAPGPWYEPNAFTLATTDSQGHVTARTILHKQHDADGFLFFTNYASEKGRQLDANPTACMLFHWQFLGQQVRIDGTVERISADQSLMYFHSRPRDAQISALASEQSSVLQSRQELEERIANLTEELAGKDVPLPENWGGYRLKPTRFEFWQGRRNRLHDRVRYLPTPSGWQRDLLSP